MTDSTNRQIDPSHERKQTSRQREPNLGSSDPYSVLGLNRNASPRQVKRAYFSLVRQYPPETQPEDFKLIRAAYEKLQNASAKAETDLFLFQSPPPWEPRKRLHKLNLNFDPQDIQLLLKNHGDLGATDFSADYRPVKI